ncbi:MAG: hypothetical protein JRJ03_15095 [Deltaproteobacteria bacterium]|nr:hypothetical protein [Deltaproteobacteria bacterium]MBW2066238.1 hypothetical protein [Deltaproteobacteria bacterium]
MADTRLMNSAGIKGRKMKGTERALTDLDSLVVQVKNNCNISDARYAGLYSVCGLALRLRDLYKWEMNLRPWEERDPSEVLAWIGEREELWEGLADHDLAPIEVSGVTYDPFDQASINGLLEGQGLIYGAGYVHGLKPSFFLADLEEKRRVDGYPVYILGRELARDLLTVPALSQDDCVLIRRVSGELYLWDQIFMIGKSGREALRFALGALGIEEKDNRSVRRNLSKIFAHEIDSYIRHEIGGLEDEIFGRRVWQGIIASFPHTSIEIFARAVKDLLADTHCFGTLRYIERKRKSASLGFYVAFLGGLTGELFPELFHAFRDFSRTGDWKTVRKAIAKGYDRARGYALKMVEIYGRGKERGDLGWAAREIRRLLLAPLGI